MRKRLLSLVLCCCLYPPISGVVHATETEQAEFLVLRMANSSTAEFKLSTRPVITFSDGKLLVASEEASAEYAQSDVTEFYFTAISTGIDEKVTGSTMTFSYVDNAHVNIYGTKANSVLLYDANGRLLRRQQVTDGKASIDVSQYAPGVYVLNLTNEHSFKIIKK